MSAGRLVIAAPLSGWCVPLSEIPDAVFAGGMAGDGVGIDPTSAELRAPCAGELVIPQGARHAITIRNGALEVVVHVGIDTVKLGGEGFQTLRTSGEWVETGAPLLRFDLDALARRVPSLVTPVLIATGGRIVTRATGRRVTAGEPLLEIELEQASAAAGGDGKAHRRQFRMPFEHGLHVRPAAQVAGALRSFTCEVSLAWRGKTANARSTVAMMTLGARQGDVLEAFASGPDAEHALRALAEILEAMPEVASPVAAPLAKPSPPRGRIAATIASRGVAMGPAAAWSEPELAVAEAGQGVDAERAALRQALDALRAHLERKAAAASGELRALLEGHAELVRDPELLGAAESWLARGKAAGFAWRSACRALASQLAALDDARMRERVADLRDLEMQALRLMRGDSLDDARRLPAGSIVLADELLPSQVLALERSAVGGVCLARGGATSHAAILAAASGLPMLVAAGAAVLAIPNGTLLVLDAERGALEIDPPAVQRASHEREATARRDARAADLALARDPALTRDGVRIAVLANLGGGDDIEAALRQGAEGCGLLRTEFLFLDRRTAPDEAEQRREYQRIAASLGGRPLAVRTMDVGGDKPLAYLPMPHEENPALGLRGLRAGLRDPALLRTQLRAIVGVDPPGAARVLLPMVTEADELHQAREWLLEAAGSLGRPMPALGVMIETPSSALLAAQLARTADFLSIGTNDLSQYALAMDRGHPDLAHRLDALHPAVLRLIAAAAEGAREFGRSLSVCGALAADHDALPILVGLGVRELSVPAGSIPGIKRRIRELQLDACEALAARACLLQGAAAVRALVRDSIATPAVPTPH